MAVYLITGLPATGKSTVGKELAERGYEVVDADERFGYYGNLMSEVPVKLPANLSKARIAKEWYTENGWLWDTIKVRQFLMQPREEPIFVYGGARNEKKFYRHFDKIFILHIPNNLLQERLSARDNPIHSNQHFITRMLIWNRAVPEQARNINGVMIDASQSIETIVNTILEQLDDNR